MTRWQAPQPKTPTYVIGDVHGCVDQLARLLDQIDTDIARLGGGEVVFVGDYIDRGKDSANVLRFVAEMTASYPAMVTGLAGNHEDMMLDFLGAPTGHAKRWLKHGGSETLKSFGISPLSRAAAKDAKALMDTANALREALTPQLVSWLSHLPTSWSSGNLWVVHAGADPAIAMSKQDPKRLMWGYGAFLEVEREDGQWVAFGHIPVDVPYADAGRIAVDTGAVYGGALTAARVMPDGEISFLSA
ncbi:metallophosphoesterase family protein [Gymnodinialimonas sp. 2305UL16-5]|uniref:metallophosphoesterase family protein n=1 Tax=Gymnodinialimonas mytili TaxID=3126503 RepID=UPI0030A66EA5